MVVADASEIMRGSTLSGPSAAVWRFNAIHHSVVPASGRRWQVGIGPEITGIGEVK
jgi:hypothetical protein